MEKSLAKPRQIMRVVHTRVTGRVTRITYEPVGKATAPVVGVPIVDHRVLQFENCKLRRELARQPRRRHEKPQPTDAWDLLTT